MKNTHMKEQQTPIRFFLNTQTEIIEESTNKSDRWNFPYVASYCSAAYVNKPTPGRVWEAALDAE